MRDRMTTGIGPLDAPFEQGEYDDRLARVRAAMAESGLDALLVTTPENIYYLTGLSHQGYFAFTMLLVPLDGRPTLVIRAMEHVIVERRAPGVTFVGYGDGEDAASAAVHAVRGSGCSGSRIGIDTSSMFFPPAVCQELQAALLEVDWIDTSRSSSVASDFRAGLVDHIRLVKSEAELVYIRQAAMVSDRAARAGLDVAGVGVNEREIAAAIHEAMITGGGEYPGFVPFVRSGESLLEEHSTWRDRFLEPGDELFIELSGARERYHAPLGRLAFVARPPERGERAREIAIAALESAREALRPGATSGDVYAAWQRTVDAALGHDRLRRHHCGYNVGIGFPPSWVGSSTVLGLRPGGVVQIEAGMVFHLWAWITDADAGDYLVSDTAVVKPEETELLTTTPRHYVIG